MHETQSHPAFRIDRHAQLSILVIELGLSAGEVGIQVNHKRQLAPFAVAPAETTT